MVYLRWKWVYCSLAVNLDRTVFPFVKQYIEDKMAAECSYDLTFRAHFLSRRKRSVWEFFVKQLFYRYLILLNSITLKSNLTVSGIQWLILKCLFCRETVFHPFAGLVMSKSYLSPQIKLMINETKNTSANEWRFEEGCEHNIT